MEFSKGKGSTAVHQAFVITVELLLCALLVVIETSTWCFICIFSFCTAEAWGCALGGRDCPSGFHPQFPNWQSWWRGAHVFCFAKLQQMFTLTFWMSALQCHVLHDRIKAEEDLLFSCNLRRTNWIKWILSKCNVCICCVFHPPSSVLFFSRHTDLCDHLDIYDIIRILLTMSHPASRRLIWVLQLCLLGQQTIVTNCLWRH